MITKPSQIILLVLLYISACNAYANTTNQKTLSYANTKLEILPLFKLSSNNISTNNIIFLHPPKVGGTNVVNIIDAIKTIKSHRFAVPRIADKSPILITDGWIGGLSAVKEQCSGPNNNCSNYNFSSGHFPYGAHSYIKGQYHYITLIRRPIERELSAVNFDYQRGYITTKKQALHQLLNLAVDNPQTRLLAGEAYMHGPCDEKTLELAKQNLAEKFLLIGVTEDTNAFIQVLLSLMQLEPVTINKMQITAKKILNKLPLTTQKKLLKKHKYDQALYEYAKDWWTKWKQHNVIGTIAIKENQKILTLLPEFANTHQACYMTSLEINSWNKLHLAAPIISIQQNHHGVDKK